MDEGKLYSLSKWRAYALKNKKGEYNNCLYEGQVDKVVEDIKNNYIIAGFTPIELFAYIIKISGLLVCSRETVLCILDKSCFTVFL